MIISVDHGNKSIKTPHLLFTSGLVESENQPGIKTDCIFWDGKYYSLTEKRISYLRDKTEDDRFFVLTLFAIAKELEYSAYTAEWQITGKTQIPYNNIAAYTTYGTDRANAYRILEDSLNLRDVRIYDTVEDADGKERRVLNAKETTLAAQKQQAIRDAFKDWIWRDPERRQALVRQYNEEMNSTRPREYDGSHIVFSGMNPEITLREHQKSAIAHVLYGGNTLLAHEVGAGKSATRS